MEQYEENDHETIDDKDDSGTPLPLTIYRPEEELFERLYLCEYLSDIRYSTD
jgi:hypothetical protein